MECEIFLCNVIWRYCERILTRRGGAHRNCHCNSDCHLSPYLRMRDVVGTIGRRDAVTRPTSKRPLTPQCPTDSHTILNIKYIDSSKFLTQTFRRRCDKISHEMMQSVPSDNKNGELWWDTGLSRILEQPTEELLLLPYTKLF